MKKTLYDYGRRFDRWKHRVSQQGAADYDLQNSFVGRRATTMKKPFTYYLNIYEKTKNLLLSVVPLRVPMVALTDAVVFMWLLVFYDKPDGIEGLSSRFRLRGMLLLVLQRFEFSRFRKAERVFCD